MLYSYKWGSEKFNLFFELPIELASIPAPFYKHIFLRNNSINSSNNQYVRVKIVVGEQNVLLYKNELEYDKLSEKNGDEIDKFREFQEAVRRQLSVGLMVEEFMLLIIVVILFL
jgi:hypothetical protein